MRAHPSFPQIDQGLIPVIIQELEDFIEMLVLSRLDIRSQLFQSEFRLGFTVAMIEDIDQQFPLMTYDSYTTYIGGVS